MVTILTAEPIYLLLMTKAAAAIVGQRGLSELDDIFEDLDETDIDVLEITNGSDFMQKLSKINEYDSYREIDKYLGGYLLRRS